MSDPATNENLREGRGERGSAGQQQGGTVRKGQTEPHVDKQSGWQTKTFGEVLEIRNGRNQREVESDDGEFPIYGSAGNVMGMATDHICEAGTTIIGRKGNINSPIYADTRFWNVDTAFGLAAKAGMDSRFLYFFCLSYDFSAHNRGTTIPSLVKSELLNIPIPVPPLAEQQRIVGLLDEAFEGLATAKANAEKNLQNARALFESHLQSVFTQRGPEWRQDQLDVLTEPDTPITYGVVKPGDEGEITFVRGGDLVRGKVRLTQLRTITRAVSDQYRRTLLRGGELLICLVGQPGQVAVAPIELAGANIARQVGLIRLKKMIDAEFVRYFLQSAPGAEALGARESGSVQQVINLGELRQVSVHYPELAQQRKIVVGLEAMESETQHLARLYEQKLAALEALKKSLLHQAFTGAL